MKHTGLLLLASCSGLGVEPGLGYMTPVDRRRDIPDFITFELRLVKDREEPYRRPRVTEPEPEEHEHTEEEGEDEAPEGLTISGSGVDLNFSKEAIKYLLGPTGIGLYFLYRRRRNLKQEVIEE